MKYKLFYLLLFLIISLLLHFKSYNQYPSKTHAWAQSDHYAIALGFLDNGFDFFHPKTYTLSHQFPPDIPLNNPKGITAIDFPISHYLAALGMKLFNTENPWVFRLLSLLWSLIAFYYLFMTILRIKGFLEAIMVISFIILIPIYSFYQNSFMPSSFAFNSLIIGMSFLLRFYYLFVKKAFYYGLFFITFAALMRFTEVIFLIALTAVYFIESLRKKGIRNEFLLSIFSLFIIGVYFLYNLNLAKTYGTVFLNKPIIADTVKEFSLHILHQTTLYIREFLTLFHISTIIVLLILFKNQNKKLKKRAFEWEYWVVISFIGVMLFNILMSYHMSGHDYYALDTWIPLISIGFIYLVLQIDFSVFKPLAKIIVLLLTTGLLVIGVEKQFYKYKYVVSNSEKIATDFRNSSQFLDDNTANGQKILIICNGGWNTPMIGWKKDVFRVANNFKKQIPEALSQNYNLIITHNATYEENVLGNMENFPDRLQKIADNSLVTVWKPKQ